MQSQVQIPQYGAYISDQIRSNSPVRPGGRVVGQHIDRYIIESIKSISTKFIVAIKPTGHSQQGK